MLTIGMTTQAQEWGTKDVPKRLDWWYGASVGITHSMAENATGTDFFHNYPGVDMQVGVFFSRAFGVRLSWGLNPQLGRPGAAQRQGDPETYDTNYRFNVLTGYVDGLLDLTTLFARNKKYRPTFDVLIYAGGGVLESFHFDKKVLDWIYYPVDTYDKTCWAAHLGFMTSYRFAPHWDWTVEGSYNMTEGRYDGVDGPSKLSGYVKFHTGFIYHIYQGGNDRVRLSTDDNSEWEPSYTDKDRERVRQAEYKRIAEAQKRNEALRAEKEQKVQRSIEEARKANERFRQQKEERRQQLQQQRQYNEN